MSQKSANSSVLRVAEWGAAAIGAVNCVLVPLLFAQQGGSDFPFFENLPSSADLCKCWSRISYSNCCHLSAVYPI